MYFNGRIIHIPIDRVQTNIPVVCNYFMSDNEKLLVGTQMRSALSHTRLSKLDFLETYFL